MSYVYSLAAGCIHCPGPPIQVPMETHAERHTQCVQVRRHGNYNDSQMIMVSDLCVSRNLVIYHHLQIVQHNLQIGVQSADRVTVNKHWNF